MGQKDKKINNFALMMLLSLTVLGEICNLLQIYLELYEIVRVGAAGKGQHDCTKGSKHALLRSVRVHKI